MVNATTATLLRLRVNIILIPPREDSLGSAYGHRYLVIVRSAGMIVFLYFRGGDVCIEHSLKIYPRGRG